MSFHRYYSSEVCSTVYRAYELYTVCIDVSVKTFGALAVELLKTEIIIMYHKRRRRSFVLKRTYKNDFICLAIC